MLWQLLKGGFGNYKLEDFGFLTENGADISVRDTTNNSAVHFPAVPFGVDIIKLLLGKRTAVKLTKLNNENLQHISAGCDNLEGRKSFVERDVALYNDKNVVSLCWLWLHKVANCKPFIASQILQLSWDLCSFFPLRFVRSTIKRVDIYIDRWSGNLMAVIVNVTSDCYSIQGVLGVAVVKLLL